MRTLRVLWFLLTVPFRVVTVIFLFLFGSLYDIVLIPFEMIGTFMYLFKRNPLTPYIEVHATTNANVDELIDEWSADNDILVKQYRELFKIRFGHNDIWALIRKVAGPEEI